MIADFERSEFTIAPCVWPTTFNQSIVPILLPGAQLEAIQPIPTSQATSHNLPLGPIIGGSLGGIALILGVGIMIYLFVFKPRRMKHNKQESVGSTDEGSTSTAELDIQKIDHTRNKMELDSKQYGAHEMLDIREVERRMTHELVGTSGYRELDTHIPVGSELEVPVYEMSAREDVANVLASSPTSGRSRELSPLSPDDETIPGFFERRGRSRWRRSDRSNKVMT
jgi:hypothetical protein